MKGPGRVVWREKGVAAVESFDLPSLKETEVLIETRATLISQGTERAFFLGAPNAVCEFPVHGPGYSNVGEILQVGSRVEGLRVGQRVVSSTGHSSHVIAEAAVCAPVADNVADEDAVFFNLITITLQAVRKARIELGEPVVVLGAGMIGLFAAQLARLHGALPVIAVDKDRERVEFARRYGAEFALVSDDSLAGAVSRASAPRGPAVVIEATGIPAVIGQAIQMARRFGRVIILGSTRGDVNGLNFYRDVHYKGLTIIGAHNSTRPQQDSSPGFWTMRDDWQTALKLLELKRLDVRPLITHRFSWKDATKPYEILARGDATAQGMVLNWKQAGDALSST